MSLIRKFALSILQCLDLLSISRIIHCDMKPENILLKNPGRSGIKVIDFGSSCYEQQRIYTYIQSRFYRAPEVIMGAQYSMPIDMWSFGCILAELYTGYPIFPGEDEGDQLACIIETIGVPDQRLLEGSKRAKNFISSQGYPRYCSVSVGSDGKVQLSGGRSKRGKYRGPPSSKDLTRALNDCEELQFVDFIRRCLVIDPTKRMTPAEALRHAWVRRKVPKPTADDSGEYLRRTVGFNNGSKAKYSSSGSHSGKHNIITATDDMTQGNINNRAKLPQIGSM